MRAEDFSSALLKKQKVKRKTQILLILISLALVGGFLFPIWDIQLEAPQYPEGLGMQIWISSIQGDLQTINGLNHYIGMKTIEPDSIAELAYMKYILIGVICIGLLAALLRSRTVFYIWFLLFVTAGIAGGVDFYLWEYDYGHNLDPRAAIKIPGMNYQPPLWGSKQLLNFTAHSYPHTGGWIIILSGLTSLLLLIYELRMHRKEKAVTVKKRTLRSKIRKPAFAAIAIMLFASCTHAPVEIDYGKDECAFCRMTIVDERFGTELLNSKGKAYKFDSVECLAKYINSEKPQNYKSYVTQLELPGKLTEAEKVYYLVSEEIPSPMGENISVHADKNIINNISDTHAQIFSWNELIEIFK